MSVKIWLQGTAAIDLSSLSAHTAQAIRSELTLLRRVFGSDEGEPTRYFIEYGDGWLHVPKGWLFTRPWLSALGVEINDARSDGRPLPVGTRAHVTFGEPPHPPGQPEFVQAIVDGCLRTGHGGLALAPTRAGKTLCSLEAACRLGRSTLIIVDNTELMKQWVNVIQEHLHVGCGIVKQGVFDYSQPFTIAMAQTLAHRQLPMEMRKAWGTVIVDECNTAPCHTIWTALSRLHARYLVGLTATPDRKDGLTEAVHWITGPTLASLTRDMYADVHWIPFPWTLENTLRSRPSPVDADKAVMEDVSRINRLADEAVRGLQSGRRVLLMATLVAHCRALGDAINARGADVDLLVGSRSMASLHAPITIATYKKASKGLDFDPPHTLFIPAGPVADIRQAVGRALQPKVPHRTMILHPYDDEPTLRRWAHKCSQFYAGRGFVFRNSLPEGRWVA